MIFKEIIFFDKIFSKIQYSGGNSVMSLVCSQSKLSKSNWIFFNENL